MIFPRIFPRVDTFGSWLVNAVPFEDLPLSACNWLIGMFWFTCSQAKHPCTDSLVRFLTSVLHPEDCVVHVAVVPLGTCVFLASGLQDGTSDPLSLKPYTNSGLSYGGCVDRGSWINSSFTCAHACACVCVCFANQPYACMPCAFCVRHTFVKMSKKERDFVFCRDKSQTPFPSTSTCGNG